MNKLKNSKFFKLFLIVILIAIIFAGFYLYNNTGVRTENTEIKQNTISEIDTSNWLTYENKEYGYRFKYPSNMYLEESPQYISISTLSINNPKRASSIGIMSSMTIQPKDDVSIDKITEQYKKDQYLDDFAQTKIENINIDNRPAAQISYRGGYGGEMNFVTLIETLDPQVILKIHYTEGFQNIFDDILNSIVLF
ncbi:PsbP-related protein [Patescibacteria group bacterium]